MNLSQKLPSAHVCVVSWQHKRYHVNRIKGLTSHQWRGNLKNDDEGAKEQLHKSKPRWKRLKKKNMRAAHAIARCLPNDDEKF